MNRGSESKSLLLNIHLKSRSSYLLAVVIHSNSSVVFIKEGLSLNRPIIVEYFRLVFFVLPPFFNNENDRSEKYLFLSLRENKILTFLTGAACHAVMNVSIIFFYIK